MAFSIQIIARMEAMTQKVKDLEKKGDIYQSFSIF